MEYFSYILVISSNLTHHFNLNFLIKLSLTFTWFKNIYIIMSFDYSFKFILVGDTAVGKTSILNRFLAGNFDYKH